MRFREFLPEKAPKGRKMLALDRIYHDDSFGLFPQIDDESLDLIICDGPYGVATKISGTGSVTYRRSIWN